MTRDQDACGLIQTRHTVPGVDPLPLVLVPQRRQPHDDREPPRHRAVRPRSSSALEAGDLVVDIGCNDGTLLDGYRTEGLRYLGFDPSDVARYAVEKGYDVVHDFFSAERCRRRYPDQKAKVVTCDRDVLRPRGPARRSSPTSPTAWPRTASGSWSCTTCRSMLETNAFDAIVHEHLEYYSLAVLERLLAEAGLEVVAAELNDINGGSIRLFIGHAGQRSDHAGAGARAAGAPRSASSSSRSTRRSPTRRFAANAERVATSCAALPRAWPPRARRSTSTAHRPRATRSCSTPTSTGARSRYAADRNPDKWGSETIAHRHPDHQRGGVARDEARLLPRAARGTSSTSSSSASRSSWTAAAGSSCRCPRSASWARRPAHRRRARRPRLTPGSDQRIGTEGRTAPGRLAKTVKGAPA